MEQYLKLAWSMVVGFTKFIVAQVLRSNNRMVDALTNLSSSALYPCHVELNIMAHLSIHNVAVLTTDNPDDCSYISPISSYLRSGSLPEDRREDIKVKDQAARYALLNSVLYRRSFSVHTKGVYHQMRQSVSLSKSTVAFTTLVLADGHYVTGL